VKNKIAQRFLFLFFLGCFQCAFSSSNVHGSSFVSGKLANNYSSESNHPRYISYKQGVVEIVIDVNNEQIRNSVTRFIDSYFVVSRMAVNELNKSLSYKMNDQIRIFVHSPISELASNLKNESPLISHIYYSESLFEMKQRLRYSIAKQYLQEYLGGILMREKLSPTAIKPPAWLILGFCNYFSKAITFWEFEKFSYLAKKGKFNNINFIESQHEELFGTIVWYLFEKEKGRSINGAFWLLLKNANSFERTFYYHFEERFNVWLKKRILEIESMGFKEGQKSDLQIPLKYIDVQAVELNLQKEEFILYLPSGRNPVKTSFNLNSLLEEDSLLNNKELSINLQENQSKPEKIQLFNPTFNSRIQLSETIKSNTYFVVIENINSESDTLKTLGLIVTLDSNKPESLPLQLESSLIQLDTVFTAKITKESVDFCDFILESPEHFSVIRNTGNHSEVLHFLYNSSEKTWNSFATGTKGYFYHQSSVPNRNQYLEYYILNNQLHVNSLNKNGELLLRDTVQKISYSFDEIQRDSITETPSLWDTSKWFISPFEYNKTRINIPRKNNSLHHSKHVYKTEDFRNWQYTESSIYYFSNQELDLSYNSNIPVERLYNSPITLFYKGSFPNLLKQSRLNFTAFTNVNRRRIGFQISHQYRLKNQWIDQQIQYRIRQFTISNSNYFRNRSVRYDLGLHRTLLPGNHIHRRLEMNLVLKNHFDQIIPLNLSENSTKSPIQNVYIQTLNWAVHDGFKFPISGINFNSDYFINFENGYYKNADETKWISAVDAKISVSKRFRMFDWSTRIKARYSFTKTNIFYWLMGNNGWIDPNQFDALSGYSSQFTAKYPLQSVGGNVRGISSASRGGTSFFNLQSEISLPITSLIPSYSINGPFLKSLKLFVWGDVGLAFVNGSPFHYKNPYNTLVYSTPNYLLTATANRDPWISSRGIGLKFRVLEMDFRFEYGLGKVGDNSTRPQFSISMGNIF